MKPDGRNLTPLRALVHLRALDEHHRGTGGELKWAIDRVREALDGHVRFGLARAKRRRVRKASR